MLTSNQKAAIVGGVVFSLLPIWRSGGRTGLNLWEWLINHTVWGPPIEYVPEEDYMTALSVGELWQ